MRTSRKQLDLSALGFVSFFAVILLGGMVGCDTQKLYSFIEPQSLTDTSDTASSDTSTNVDTSSELIPSGDTSTDDDTDTDSDVAWYPCDGSPDGYNATAIQSDDTWTVQNAGNVVYTGADMEAAIRAAYGSLTVNRTEKESVLIQGSGDVSADSQIRIPSYTIVNVCGTINVIGSGTGDMSPMFARAATDIDVPNVRITGTPNYGMFFRETNNVRLGQIVLELDAAAWLGIRIDHSSSAAVGKPLYSNYQLDYVYVTGPGSHGIETFGITDISFDEVYAENTGDCGLNLNYSTYVEVGTITGLNCGVGSSNGTLCFSNETGNVNDDGTYPEGNVHVGSVSANGGGRGIFLFKDSGGVTIDSVDIVNTESNAVLLENAHQTTIATESGTITGPADLRIAGTSDNIVISNLSFQDSALNENPCGANIQYDNLTFVNTPQNTCK